ncbi:hypothetical protein C4D60_Mb03t04850 [Musa balbisiana]|uniref:Uncharacterized protein n=1 Tax=Musa balbisiana TaxID=52838 RepID=A0A4S8J9B1_MUSBA|nr:hypothetical protein C4D60_Mb03t04850 [Musa balbisiana]
MAATGSGDLPAQPSGLDISSNTWRAEFTSQQQMQASVKNSSVWFAMAFLGDLHFLEEYPQ